VWIAILHYDTQKTVAEIDLQKVQIQSETDRYMAERATLLAQGAMEVESTRHTKWFIAKSDLSVVDQALKVLKNNPSALSPEGLKELEMLSKILDPDGLKRYALKTALQRDRMRMYPDIVREYVDQGERIFDLLGRFIGPFALFFLYHSFSCCAPITTITFTTF
jgi:hypothetical protein